MDTANIQESYKKQEKSYNEEPNTQQASKEGCKQASSPLQDSRAPTFRDPRDVHQRLEPAAFLKQFHAFVHCVTPTSHDIAS
jgi:hypothetical protein